MKYFKRGFTLIELLIAIAIVGILSVLIMANFVGVRQRARDAQRKSDLQQIRAALELYRADLGGYPASVSCGSGITNGSTTYMQKVPCDPAGASYTYNSGTYYYNLSGSTYTLAACLENNQDSTAGTTSTSPGGTGTCAGIYYVLNNP